jgi:hypothetical protein
VIRVRESAQRLERECSRKSGWEAECSLSAPTRGREPLQWKPLRPRVQASALASLRPQRGLYRCCARARRLRLMRIRTGEARSTEPDDEARGRVAGESRTWTVMSSIRCCQSSCDQWEAVKCLCAED